MKTKKGILRIIVVMALMVLLAVPASPVVAAPSVSVGLPAAQVPVGGSFDVTIDVADLVDFDAAQYDVTYDPAVIQVTDVSNGLVGTDEIPVGLWGLIPTGTQGTVRVINNVPDYPGVDGSGYLAVIHFSVVGSAGTDSDITFSNGLLGDVNAEEITGVSWTNGSVDVVAPVAADFTADETDVFIDEVITFTSSPTGGSGVFTYAWDFGDTGTSTEANPDHSYSTPGSYTVSLTVTDTLNGSDIETKDDYITVYGPVAADFSSDITALIAGDSVDFTAIPSGGSSPYTYEWDFGDGDTTDNKSANPNHTYAAAGTYNVSLTVTDSLDGSDTETKDNYITVYTPVTADFSANATQVLVGQSISFTADPTDGSGSFTYGWDFGDISTSDEENPTHSYATVGTYTVALTVTDTLGGGDTETKDNYITVYDTLVATATSDNDTVAVGETVSFTGSATGGKPGYSYDWDFGDTNSSTEQNPTHSYGAKGVYTVTLTVTDDLGNTDEDTITITVYARGDADGNGAVEANDITHIERIIMEEDGFPATSWADANNDGEVNALDITATEIIIMESP